MAYSVQAQEETQMTTTFTKSEIFQSAWCTARQMAAEAGTGPRAQFGAALTATYQMIKEMAAHEALVAERKRAREEDEFQELQQVEDFLFHCGPRASAAKDQARARAKELRQALAA